MVIKCASCKLYFATDEQLNEHFVNIHKEFLTCKQCKKMFPDHKRMYNHLNKSHVDKSKKVLHICAKCGTKKKKKIT